VGEITKISTKGDGAMHLLDIYHSV